MSNLEFIKLTDRPLLQVSASVNIEDESGRTCGILVPKTERTICSVYF